MVVAISFLRYAADIKGKVAFFAKETKGCEQYSAPPWECQASLLLPPSPIQLFNKGILFTGNS